MQTMARATRSLLHAALTSAGVRPLNEDMVFADGAHGLYVVADGIGGAGKGDLACEIVARCLAADPANGLEALNKANQEIGALIQSTPEKKGMGATVAMALVREGKADLYHLGEVRAYLLRGDQALQLTEDHTLATQLVKLKQLTPEQALTHPARKTPLRFLGKEPELKLEHKELPLNTGDVLLLCSDGFHAAVDKDTLAAVARGSALGSLDDRLEAAVNQALAAGSQDNVSVLAVRVVGESDPSLAAPAEASRQLRALVEWLLASPEPARDFAVLGEDALRVLQEASRASQAALAIHAEGVTRPLAGARLLVEASAELCARALAQSEPAVLPGAETRVAIALPGPGFSLLVCLALPSWREETVLPTFELLRWLVPLYQVATRLRA